MSNFPVPKIDQLAGIECYCTCYSGTGGLIKQSSEGFKVSEIIDCSVFDASVSCSRFIPQISTLYFK